MLFVLLVLTVAVNPATLMFGVLAVALIRNGALVLRPTESRRGCHGRFAFYQTADRLLGCGDERSRSGVLGGTDPTGRSINVGGQVGGDCP